MLVYEMFSELFCFLPLAAVIGGKVLVLHGGLFSRDDVTLDDIRKIDRNQQPGDSGVCSSLLSFLSCHVVSCLSLCARCNDGDF